MYVGQYYLLSRQNFKQSCGSNFNLQILKNTNSTLKPHHFFLTHTLKKKTPFSVSLVFVLSVIMEDNYSQNHHHSESQSHKNHQHNDILPSTSVLLIIVPIIIIILLIAISLLIVMLKRIQSAKHNGTNNSSKSVINKNNCMFVAHSTIDIHLSPGNTNSYFISFFFFKWSMDDE